MTRRIGLLFGGLLAGVFMAFLLGFGRPAGPGVFLVVMAVFLLLTSWMPWRRLDLRLTTIGMVVSAIGLSGLGWASLVQSVDTLSVQPVGLRVTFLVAVITGPFLLLADSRINPEGWIRWRSSIGKATFRDVLRGRHIPHPR